MEDVLVFTDGAGGTAILTTDSPSSIYGFPILRIESFDISGDFAPSDIIESKAIPQGYYHAAEIVAGWGSQPERTPEELAAARLYLSQWPDGPQIIDPE